MTAHDPSITPARGNLLHRLEFGRTRHSEHEQDPATPGLGHSLVEAIEGRLARLEPITIGWLKSISEANIGNSNDQFDKIFDLL